MVSESGSLQGATGVTLGRYRLIQRIGQGGMGEVWLAEDPRLHRQVAIKTLPVRTQGDREYLQRFEREARAAAALNHPHILPVHDFGEQQLANGQSITYLVMPYIQGGSLSSRITWLMNNHAGMPQQEAIQYLWQAAEAIDYAHAQGVIHRDIKPANMLLRDANWLMLADFGIARIMTDQERLTQTGMGFGTPEYMAPEQAQGQAVPASDLYSLGVIAYELFTGRVPFKADTPYATTIQHIMSPPPPPRQINPSLSPAVEQVLLRGLAKDPAQRAPSARAFVSALQQALAGAPYEATLFKQALPSMGGAPINPAGMGYPTGPDTTGPAALVPGTGTTKREGITRRSLLIAGSATILAAGAGLGIWAYASRRGQPGPQIQKSPLANTPGHATPTAAVSSSAPDFVLLGHSQGIGGLAWSPSQQATTVLASIDLDGQVMVWSLPTQSGPLGQQARVRPRGSQQPGAPDTLMQLSWSPDGSMLAVGNVNSQGTNLDLSHGYTAIYKSDLSGFASGLTAPLAATGSNIIETVAWVSQRYLIAGVNLVNGGSQLTSQFTFYDLNQITNPNPPTATLPVYISDGTTRPEVPMAVSPADNSLLAIASSGNNDFVTIATVLPGNPPGLKLVTNTATLIGSSGVTWSADGAYVAAYSYDHTLNPNSIAVYDARHNYQQVNSPTLPGGIQTDLRALAWSPNTSHLLAAGDSEGNIYLWKYYPGSGTASPSGNNLPVAMLPGTLKDKNNKPAAVAALAWSNDGNWLAAGYGDLNSTIYVWNSSRWQG
jgi:serine/threonine protein kinase